MSELNYINETVVPRMPKSVSDEQLFVFVPVGNDTVAGIFKINARDFDKSKLPVLTIKQDDTITENGIGFVRGGAVYTFVKSEVGYLNNIKQDKNLSEPIAGKTTVEGALTNLAGRMNIAEDNVTDLKGRMLTAEGNINTLKTTVGDATSGLVKQVNDNSAAIIANKNDTDDAIGALQRQLNTTNKNLENTEMNVTALSNNKQDKAINIPGIEAKNVEGALTELDGESSAHAESINSLKAADEGLTVRVTNLEQSAYGGETPIGT